MIEEPLQMVIKLRGVVASYEWFLKGIVTIYYNIMYVHCLEQVTVNGDQKPAANDYYVDSERFPHE